jgi:hypothetical protein
MSWTEEEIQYLHDNYSSTPAEYLAKEFSKSESAVKKKAYREGLSANDRKWKSERAVRDGETIIPVNSYMAGYVCGLVDGEGSFNFSKQTNNDENLRFRFTVSMDDDKELLEEVQEFFGGCGKIYVHDSEERERINYSFTVTSVEEILLNVIPVFENYNLKGRKVDQYREWKDKFLEYWSVSEKYEYYN